MKRLFSKFFLISAMLISAPFDAALSQDINADKDKIVSEIKVDYLYKIPSNDYILGPGDVIEINFSMEYPEYQTKASIDGEGTIYLPLLNRVYVEGLSINELNNLLNESLKYYLKYPNVQTSIKFYRPIRIFVDGEVNDPGFHTLNGFYRVNTSDTNNNKNITIFPTLFDGIREAGGITNKSDLTSIQIIRNDIKSNGGGKKSAFINFDSVITSGEMNNNLRIYDGDIIKMKKNLKPAPSQISRAIKSNLNPKEIKITVSGRVNIPGTKFINKESTLNDAILASGGTKYLKGKIVFIRFNNDGTLEKRKFNYAKNSKNGSYNNPFLEQNDLIFVSDNIFSTSAQVINEVSSPFMGLFSSYGLYKAITD